MVPVAVYPLTQAGKVADIVIPVSSPLSLLNLDVTREVTSPFCESLKAEGKPWGERYFILRDVARFALESVRMSLVFGLWLL